VIETDEFIQPNRQEGKSLLAMDRESKEYKAAWTKYLDDVFAGMLKRRVGPTTTNFVFVGLLRQFVPGDEAPYVFKQANRRYYLSPPKPQLVKQYYSRFASYDDDFWRGVVSRQSLIPDSYEFLTSQQYHIPDSHVFLTDVSDLASWHPASRL